MSIRLPRGRVNKTWPDEVMRQAESRRRSFQNIYWPRAAELLKHITCRRAGSGSRYINSRRSRVGRIAMVLLVSTKDLRDAIAGEPGPFRSAGSSNFGPTGGAAGNG